MKTDEVLKNVKDLSHEVGAWNMRLEHAKSEVLGLKNQKAELEQQLNQVRQLAEQEISGKLLKARQEGAKVDEDRKRLDETKKAIDQEALSLRQERNAFEREKSDTLALKAELEGLRQRVGKFILTVRRESEGL